MSNEFDKYIRQYCHQHKITLEKLAETAGIARGTLYHLLSERSCPKFPSDGGSSYDVVATKMV